MFLIELWSFLLTRLHQAFLDVYKSTYIDVTCVFSSSTLLVALLEELCVCFFLLKI